MRSKIKNILKVKAICSILLYFSQGIEDILIMTLVGDNSKSNIANGNMVTWDVLGRIG